MKVQAIPIEWNPDLPIFASEPFLNSVGDGYGWLGGFDSDGTRRCILPYTIVRKAIWRMARFRVETIPVKGELTIDEERAFLNAVVEYLRKMSVDLIIPATTNTIFRTYPDGAVAAPYGTYIVDLGQKEDALWSGLSSSHRRKVRMAEKANVRIRTGVEHLEDAYVLVRDTFKRSSLPFMGLDAFRKMITGLGENVRISVADYNGESQACIVVPFSRHSAYYVYGGSIPDPQSGATNLLHWDAIRHFRGLGSKRYDFVGVRIDPQAGSKQEGLSLYKQRFGGQLVQGYMWKYSLHPLKYRLYCLAARLRTGGDIVDYEHHKRMDGETVGHPSQV